MENRVESGWTPNQMHLSSLEQGNLLLSTAYEGSLLHTFVDPSYTAPPATSNFIPTTAYYQHKPYLPSGHDAVSSSSSTSQLYEESSTDSSVMSGPTFTDMTSSMTSVGADNLSDISSRKASMSSSYEGTLHNHMGHSPEIEASLWPSVPASTLQPNSTYSMHYGNSTASNALTPTSYFSSMIDSSQAMNDSTQSMTSSNLSTLQINGIIHQLRPAATMSMSMPVPSPAMTSPSYLGSINTSLPLPSPNKSKQSAKVRSSTSGTTRRAKFQRSRTGCMVCRKRKVKCDQDGHPCKQCRIGKRDCHYEDNPPKRKRLSKSKSDSESGQKERDSSEDAKSISVALDDVKGKMLKSVSGITHAGQDNGAKAAQGQSLLSDEARSIEQEEEELRKTSDALFAQHTIFDQVESEEDESRIAIAAQANELVQSVEKEAQFDSVSLQYPNLNEIDAPWTGQSNPTSTVTTDDWSTNTPSTGPSSLSTTDEDPLHFITLRASNDAFPKGTDIISSSPLHKFLDLDDDVHDDKSHGAAVVDQSIEEMAWYRAQSESNQSALGVETIMNESVLKED